VGCRNHCEERFVKLYWGKDEPKQKGVIPTSSPPQIKETIRQFRFEVSLCFKC
jgi:hypothetical protein